MDKKKERSSKQKLRVEVNRGSGLEDGNLMLANPMAGGELSHRVALGTTHQNVDQVQAKAFVWKKNRPKSPSLLRFFVRGTRKTSEDIDDSTSSDHEDGLSVSIIIIHTYKILSPVLYLYFIVHKNRYCSSSQFIEFLL